jgi:hypothetical protein
MHRSRAPLRGQGVFSAAQFSAGYITNMPAFDLRQAQLAESSQKRDLTTDCGAYGPMSQQDASDSHGYEMHPQKFVQLVGCHDSNAGKHDATGCQH